jgi:dephospho-CoA kinase
MAEIPPPTDPARYARLQRVMARCLALSWDARISAERCQRARQQRADRAAVELRKLRRP